MRRQPLLRSDRSITWCKPTRRRQVVPQHADRLQARAWHPVRQMRDFKIEKIIINSPPGGYVPGEGSKRVMEGGNCAIPFVCLQVICQTSSSSGIFARKVIINCILDGWEYSRSLVSLCVSAPGRNGKASE
ncbi:hypothetical protein TNCV_70881 [Trichonephila clavipes]|nr:hypothetical protein TNCV_70881 [Trichonephila clavipes]